MTAAFQFPWDDAPLSHRQPPAPASEPAAESGETKRKRRGRRPASVVRATALARTTQPDWRYHHLTVSGPEESVEKFAAAARGAGVTPWQLDYAAIEEDVFVRAVSQPAHRRSLTIEGCRILARQFRDRVAAHQARAAALVGHSFVCPFDLHGLLPVPTPILQLGPTHPQALAWLAAHWGVTDRLRQVTLLAKPTIGRRLPRGNTVTGYGFFTAGESPHAAIAQLAARWAAVRFFLQPRPAA